MQALGTTIYVNGNGNDTNAGTSDQPVKTLTKAIELAGENGTVIMQDTVRNAGNVVLDNNVTIKRGGACPSGMINLDEGSLTINHATIDGNKGEYPTAGRIIRIMGEPVLTINEGAKICNNAGAAIEQTGEKRSGEGALFTMNGGEICNIGNGNIVAEFNPTQAVPVYDSSWTDGRVIVSYKDGLTARKSDFVKFNKTETQDILQDGQNLKSTNIVLVEYDVMFKEEAGTTIPPKTRAAPVIKGDDPNKDNQETIKKEQKITVTTVTAKDKSAKTGDYADCANN